jgi:hypothetical protein
MKTKIMTSFTAEQNGYKWTNIDDENLRVVFEIDGAKYTVVFNIYYNIKDEVIEGIVFGVERILGKRSVLHYQLILHDHGNEIKKHLLSKSLSFFGELVENQKNIISNLDQRIKTESSSLYKNIVLLNNLRESV